MTSTATGTHTNLTATSFTILCNALVGARMLEGLADTEHARLELDYVIRSGLMSADGAVSEAGRDSIRWAFRHRMNVTKVPRVKAIAVSVRSLAA